MNCLSGDAEKLIRSLGHLEIRVDLVDMWLDAVERKDFWSSCPYGKNL
jgi:hypothetical protein